MYSLLNSWKDFSLTMDAGNRPNRVKLIVFLLVVFDSLEIMCFRITIGIRSWVITVVGVVIIRVVNVVAMVVVDADVIAGERKSRHSRCTRLLQGVVEENPQPTRRFDRDLSRLAEHSVLCSEAHATTSLANAAARQQTFRWGSCSASEPDTRREHPKTYGLEFRSTNIDFCCVNQGSDCAESTRGYRGVRMRFFIDQKLFNPCQLRQRTSKSVRKRIEWIRPCQRGFSLCHSWSRGCSKRPEVEIENSIEVSLCKIIGKFDSRGNPLSGVCQVVRSCVLSTIWNEMASNLFLCWP